MPTNSNRYGRHIWNAESGEEIAVLKQHSDYSVNSVAFSADGKRVVTASGDGTARIWDAESAKEIAVLKGHTGFVDSAAFSGDDKRVVTASRDHTARIWDVTWATLVRGDALRERVCAEKLIGAAEEFTDDEMEDASALVRVQRNPAALKAAISTEQSLNERGGHSGTQGCKRRHLDCSPLQRGARPIELVLQALGISEFIGITVGCDGQAHGAAIGGCFASHRHRCCRNENCVYQIPPSTTSARQASRRQFRSRPSFRVRTNFIDAQISKCDSPPRANLCCWFFFRART